MLEHHKRVIVQRKIRVSELVAVFRRVPEGLVGMPPCGSRGVALALIDGVPVGDLPKRNNINRGGDEYGHRPFTGIHQCRAFAASEGGYGYRRVKAMPRTRVSEKVLRSPVP